MHDVPFHPDGERVATVGEDGTARVLDAATGEEVFRHGGLGRALHVDVSPDGRHLAVGSSTGVRLLAVGIGEATLLEEGKDPGGATRFVPVAFSPDGSRLLAVPPNGRPKVWAVETGGEVFTLGETSVEAVAWSPDGSRIATGGEDGTVRLWDATTGRELLVLQGHEDEVTGVAVSGDGSRLASMSKDGTVRLWAVRIEDLLRLARERVTRSLTEQECRQYLHLDRCPTA